jgi:hypothetical protein
MLLTQSGLADPTTARPWPADRVERWPIERLIPYANNARLHTAADLDKIAASIRKWGWTMPVQRSWRSSCCAGERRSAVRHIKSSKRAEWK